jgi:hypothetical protein
MSHGKHIRQIRMAPIGPFRWTLTLLGVWSFVASAFETQLRYDRVIDFMLASILVAAGVTPPEYRSRVRKVVRWAISMLLAIAGIVAGASIVEAMSLTAGAVTAGILSLLFTAPPQQARHSAPAA